MFSPSGVAAIAWLLLSCAVAWAQDGVPVSAPAPSAGAATTPSEWKLSTALGPAYAQGKGGERWAALIRERSGGRLAVRHYPGATLFQRNASREFAALREGSITLAVGSTLAWSSDVPELNLIALPWLLPSERALDALLDGAVGAELAARLEALGVVVIAWASNGFVEIASKRPLRAPADFAGLRVRTPGIALLDQTLAQLGATTAAMRGADARLAALAGGLDAEETTTSAYRASHAAAAGFSHLQLWGAHGDALVFAVNRAAWNACSAADRELVRQAARDAAADAIALRARQGGDAALGEAARQGATVTRLTDAGKQAFRNAARPVYDRWAAMIGADLVRRAEAPIAPGAATR
ncbi:MAG TPA: TRAP transporter substrate-binding protein DctP [Casimicrobiaceae bacterium]|nr:TRAP transporter substrate-binding protein DctP [Casimicrobiaceae bacterium]